MNAKAYRIQALAITIVRIGESDREFRETVIGPPRKHETREDSDLWYRRHCLSVSRFVQRVAQERGEQDVSLVLGQFQDETDPQPIQHAWLELSDGTIVDPTSAQVNGPECAVVQRADREYDYYRDRGSWEASWLSSSDGQ